jgi:Transposase, Mutator family
VPVLRGQQLPNAPAAAAADGNRRAPGLIGAVELVLSNRLRQRCLIHRCRNLPVRVPKHAQAEVKAAFWAIFDDSDAEPGETAVAHARQRAHAFADRYDRRYPAAVACCWRPCPSSPPFLRFRGSIGPRIRHTNLVGRTFGETRRRVKVIGRLPGVGGAGPHLARLARGRDDPGRGVAAAGSTPPGPPPTTARGGGRPDRHRRC